MWHIAEVIDVLVADLAVEVAVDAEGSIVPSLHGALGAECEDTMMCKKPFLRTPAGVKKIDTLLSEEARLAATPFGCGQCLPCKINASRVWKHRILLENLIHDESTFITLTYSDEFLSTFDGDKNSVHKRHVQLFMKRLRRILDGKEIRFFAVGEYGDKTWRPHYHIIIFGIGPQYIKTVERAWSNNNKVPIGFVSAGDVNNNSAAYIAQYTIKKLTNGNDPRVKEQLKGKNPEFMLSSRKNGGIGIGAIRKIGKELKENKYVPKKVIRNIKFGGQSVPLGRYLTRKLAEEIGVPETEFLSDFWMYQEELFNKHLNADVYFDSIIDEKKSERESQRKKHKIFNARRNV